MPSAPPASATPLPSMVHAPPSMWSAAASGICRSTAQTTISSDTTKSARTACRCANTAIPATRNAAPERKAHAVPPGMPAGYAGARPATKSPTMKCATPNATRANAKQSRPKRESPSA